MNNFDILRPGDRLRAVNGGLEGFAADGDVVVVQANQNGRHVTLVNGAGVEQIVQPAEGKLFEFVSTAQGK